MAREVIDVVGRSDAVVARGRLRIYLGAAPGVGKTFAMLDEGWRRRQRGTDVVVGIVETHGRARTEAQLRDLEVVPRRPGGEGTATSGGELDVDAVLARAPEVVLVDDLAHGNGPGAARPTRADDARVLLDAGIDVIATVNVEHLESLRDVVEDITGVAQQETIADAVVRAADQVELVDMDPEALRRRLVHGNVYGPEAIGAALAGPFRTGTLTALRELALLWVADRVDASLQGYRQDHGIEGAWETHERVVVAVTGAPSGDRLVRRAARVAGRANGELLGVHVRPVDGPAAGRPELLDARRQLLEDLGGTYHEVVGAEVASALISFAEAERATQLVLGASHRSRWRELRHGSVINAVARRAHRFDLHVIGDDGDGDEAGGLPRTAARTVAVSARRRVAGWLVAVVGIPLVTVALLPLRDHLDLSVALMGFLMVVVLASAAGGAGPGLAAAVVSFLALNWYFTEPVHELTIADTENAVALAGFLAVAGVVSALVTQAARRNVAGRRAAAEAEALARVAGGLVGSDDPLPPLLDRLRATFGLDGAAVEVRDPVSGSWSAESVAGEAEPAAAPQAAGPPAEVIDLDPGARLVLRGAPLAAEDRRVLHAFVAQLASALERRRLRAEAAAALVAAESDALRTALLRAVSHDLRTPLASIKASVSSLLQRDIDWPPAATEAFLDAIDQETDRLDALVGNLLDMSRLEAGVLEARPVAVGWDEVVAAALSSLSEATDRVVVSVPESLPPILADPALLERSVANLVANAIRHAGPDARIRVDAVATADRVDLRVVDDGRGIDPAIREQLFRPFQRLGDRSHEGVGLGLAVAQGFVRALGGELEAEETPGGGLTMVIRMPVA